MDVDQAMQAIDRAVETALSDPGPYEASHEGRSRRRAYERSIEAVREVAGRAEAARLATWIEISIRDGKTLPASRSVRRKGARLCRKAGHSVASHDWLDV